LSFNINDLVVAVGAVICEPVSDARSLFSGKIQANLRIQALKTTVGAAFLHVDK